MRILHLTNHLNTGGITTYIRTLAGEQVKAGHDVFVWGAQGICSQDLRALGITVLENVPRCKSELSPRLWLTLPKLIRILKIQSVDIVHAHTRVTQVLAAAAGFFTKIPYVTTAHMFYSRRLGRRLFPCVGKRIIAISTVIEEGVRSALKAGTRLPVVVVPNGMDVKILQEKFDKADRAKVRAGYGFGKEDLVILSLSRLVPVKGAHFLIEAFAVAHQEIPELKLLVAGTGDPVYSQALKDRVRALHLEADVLFPGNEPAIEKPLRAADIFAAPYLWEEPFGLSVLEAMTVGLPVAGAISGGLVELLENGNRGLLFKKGDVADLASCFLRYAKDAALRSAMGKSAREAAFEYTSLKMCERIQKVYEDVLKEIA